MYISFLRLFISTIVLSGCIHCVYTVYTLCIHWYTVIYTVSQKTSLLIVFQFCYSSTDFDDFW